jgi:transcriptional regulator with XRE-family HTH domain
MAESRGSRLFAAKLREKGRGAQAEIAKQLTVGPDLVSRWVSGANAPSAGHRLFIQEEYGIGWELWDDHLAESEGAA